MKGRDFRKKLGGKEDSGTGGENEREGLAEKFNGFLSPDQKSRYLGGKRGKNSLGDRKKRREKNNTGEKYLSNLKKEGQRGKKTIKIRNWGLRKSRRS